MRLIVAVLIAVFAANGEEVSKDMVGSWKFEAKARATGRTSPAALLEK